MRSFGIIIFRRSYVRYTVTTPQIVRDQSLYLSTGRASHAVDCTTMAPVKCVGTNRGTIGCPLRDMTGRVKVSEVPGGDIGSNSGWRRSQHLSRSNINIILCCVLLHKQSRWCQFSTHSLRAYLAYSRRPTSLSSSRKFEHGTVKENMIWLCRLQVELHYIKTGLLLSEFFLSVGRTWQAVVLRCFTPSARSVSPIDDQVLFDH